MSSSPLWKLPASELAAMLARGDVSAHDVTAAHLERIEAVEPRLHAFTEVLRDRALADADRSDARRRHGEARGPFEGLPVTFKECFDMDGRATTLGLPMWRDRVSHRDAALVELLRDAGAVVLGRTNLSQTMLFPEARNPLYGRTANPWSTAHTPGGSSGGEAAAVASGMSPLGFGTDIGGSIRIPAAFCGVCGFKPSLDRLPMRGYRGVLAGQEGIRGMGGPLARTVADLVLFFRSVDPRAMGKLDPRVPPVPWEDPAGVPLAGLRVGVYVEDGVLDVSGAIARAVGRAADALRARGCDVVPFVPPDFRAVLATYFRAMSADGGAAVIEALRGGEVDPVLEPMRRVARVPPGVRRAVAAFAGALGQPNVALMLRSIGEDSAGELWKVTERLRTHRADLLAAMDAARVDALLCPASATPAMPHGGSKNFAVASSHAFVFNVAQLPAGVVPVTRVRHEETARAPGRELAERMAARVDALSIGLPVGVQVVSRPWRDHVALALMGAIEADVGRDRDFPRTPVEDLA